MKKIEKKAWPLWFNKILDGSKTYDFRLADFKINKGDILVLKEWNPKTKKYTGRKIEKKVSYVGKFKIDKLPWSRKEVEKYGFQILAFK